MACSGCDRPLPSTFACVEPVERPKSKVCTDAAIDAIVQGCWVTGKTCAESQKSFPDCAQCMLKDRDASGTPVGWIDVDAIDIAACVHAIDPMSSCGKTQQCATDCVRSVCEECDPSVDQVEWKACRTRALAVGGACRAQAMDLPSCETDPRFARCFLTTNDDLLPFFRGACRDGADWSKADVGDGTLTAGDAGTD
jgi:hypothetical protein